MFTDYPNLEIKLIKYWRTKRQEINRNDFLITYGYSRVRLFPFGVEINNMYATDKLSLKTHKFLHMMVMKTPKTEDPLFSGGLFINYNILYIKKLFNKNTFHKCKKELVDLEIIIHQSNQYYTFNPHLIKTIKNHTKVISTERTERIEHNNN